MPRPAPHPARPRAVLVGLPGAGKSTIGNRLARALGVPLLDTDEEIERTAGTSIARIFAEHGEAHFRELEHRTVTRLLAEHDGVLALGGGAPTHPGTRAALAGHTVVLLDVSVERALERVSRTDVRPLLRAPQAEGGPRARLAELERNRRPLYAAVATVVVTTDDRPPEDIVSEIRARLDQPAGTTRVRVGPAPGYDVVIGRGLGAGVGELLGAGARRALVVHPSALAGRAELLRASLAETGREVVLAEVPDGEAAKTIEVAAACWDLLGNHRFGRQDAVVGLGGGATTDLAGFVAATWLRGVRLVNVPTTLLGMVDAAVGGKTGINTTAGKNLVGSFYAPAGVVCDLDALASLPAADLHAGLAEVVKCGFIADERILELIGEHLAAEPGVDADAPVLHELVERAVRVKAHVVGQDLRESGLRETLNYGHTLAHAIERTEGYRWRHGDAVAVGMVYAAELAHLAGLLDAEVVHRHRQVLSSLGLPTGYRPDRWDELLDAMRNDKKVRADELRFVVLTGVAATTILADPAPEVLQEAYRAISSVATGTARGGTVTA